MAVFLISMLVGADAAQMQAIMQQITDIMDYVGMPNVEDWELAEKLNDFFQAPAVKLYEGDLITHVGYWAEADPPGVNLHPGHVYVYNYSRSGEKTLYFEIIRSPYYDFASLPDWLKRELWYNYTDPLAPMEPLVIYYRYNDEQVPWAGDKTSLSVFLSRMLLLAKLMHITYSNPVDLAEQWSNYLDRFQFDFDDLDYIYRNFPIFLENPWLWLESGSSLNTLMELIGSGVMLSDFAYVSGDNPVYNFLGSVWGAEQLNSLWSAAFNQTDAWQLVRLDNETWVPLPYLVTYTHVLDEMGLLDLYGEADSEILGASSNWNLSSNGADSLYSYEFILSSTFDSLATSALISSCSNASEWNVTGENVTLSTDGYSLIVSVTGNHSNTTTLSHNLTEPLDLSEYDTLLLWFNINATRSDFTTLKITVYDEEGDWREFSTWAYDTSDEWVRLSLDLDEPDSMSGALGSLASVTITADPADVLNYTLMIDDVRVNSHIVCECLWDTDWTYQLVNGTGNANITVYGFPYVYDYPYSLALEWNLTEPDGTAKYVYNPQGGWSLDSEGFLTFMLYGFGAEDQNVTLTVRLCTDSNNTLEYDTGFVDWYGWRKVVLPLQLMNASGTVDLTSIDYVEFELGELTNGTGMLVVSDVEIDSAQWVKVEFVVPSSITDVDGDSYKLINLYCWNGSNWVTVGRWDADDTNSSIGPTTLFSNLIYLDGTLASELFSSQSLCIYPVGTGFQSPYSGEAGVLNYTTDKDSAGFAVLMPPPDLNNMSSVLFRVEVQYDSTNHYVNSHDYPLALFYFDSSFTNLTLTANDTQDNQYELFYGNGSTILILNLVSALGEIPRNLTKFQAEAENITLISGVFSSLDNWTVDSLNSTLFVIGGESLFAQGSEHLYLNYTFSPTLNVSYDDTFIDVIYSSSYSYETNETNLTLWILLDDNWVNYTLPENDGEPRRIRIPLNGSNLQEISFEHQTNTTKDWFQVEEIELFYLTNITQHIQTAEGYMNQTSVIVPGYSPRFIQILNTTELPTSMSTWAYVTGASSLIVEFYDENSTFLDSDIVTGNGSSWYPICLVDLTIPTNTSTLKFIVAAERLDHAYLSPSMLTSSGIYESFNSLNGWYTVGNGTAENNTQGLMVALDENETVALWTDVSVLGFDFSRFDTIAAAYNLSGNINASIVFEWLLADADGEIVQYQSQVPLSNDSWCAIDPVSHYYKIYTPIPFPFADCVENFTYTNFDLNRIMLNFSGAGVANVSWVQTQYIPEWDFISVTENITSTHLYVNWLTKSLVIGGVFNSTGEPNWVGVMHIFSQDVNLTTNPMLEVNFRTHNQSLKVGLEVLVYDEQGFQWVWKQLPSSEVIFEHPIYTPSFINVPDYLMAQDGHLYTSLRAIRIYVNDTGGCFNGLGSLEIGSVWLHPACGAPLSFLVLDDFEADDLSRWQRSEGWDLPYADLNQWTGNLLSDYENLEFSPVGWQDEDFQQGWNSVYSFSSDGDILTWSPTSIVSKYYSVGGSYSDTEVVEQVYWGYNNHPTMSYMRLGRTHDWLYVWYVKRDFVRFKLDIPRGSLILNACLSFASYNTQGSTNINCEILLLNYDNCSDFSSNPIHWSTTSESVPWTPPATTANLWYNTTDITNLLQTYINMEDYEPGCYAGFKIQDLNDVDKEKEWYQYDGNPSYAPRLYVTCVPQNYTIQKSINVDTDDYPYLHFRAKASENSTINVALGTSDDQYYYINNFNLTTSYQTFIRPITSENGFTANSITIYYPNANYSITVNVDYLRLTRYVDLQDAATNNTLSENGGFEYQSFTRWESSNLESKGIVGAPVSEGSHSAEITCNGGNQYLYRTVPGDKIISFSIYKPFNYSDQRRYFFQLHDQNLGKDITYYLVDVFDTDVGSHETNNKKFKWVQKPGTFAHYVLDISDLYHTHWNMTAATVEVRFGVETSGSENMTIDDFRVYDPGETKPHGIELSSGLSEDDYASLKLLYYFPSASKDICTYTYKIERDFSQEQYLYLQVNGDNSNHSLSITLQCSDGTFGGWKIPINWAGPKKLTLPLNDYDYQSQTPVSGQLEKIVFKISEGSHIGNGWITISGLAFGHQYNFTLTSESWSGEGAVRIQNPGEGWVRVYAESSSVGRIPFTPDELLCFAVLPKGRTPWAVLVDFSMKDGETATLCWYRGDRPIPEKYHYDYLSQLDSNPDNWNEFRLNLFDAVKNYAEMAGRSGFQYIEKVTFLVGGGEAVFDSVLIRNIPENLDTSALSVLSSPVIFFHDEAYPCTLGDTGNDWALVNQILTELEQNLEALNINVVWADAQETRKLMSAYPRSLLVIVGGIVPDTLCGKEGYSVLENFVERGGTVVFLSDDQAPLSAVGREGYETLWFRDIGLEYLLDCKTPTMELYNYSSLEPVNMTVEPTEMGASLGARDSLNVSGFAWLITYLRYQNVWVEPYYYNSEMQLGRGVCMRPRDSLGYVAEFPVSLLSENYTGVVVNFISDHFINLWLDTSGFNFDDYERPLPGVSDERFIDYFGEWESGNWTFDTSIPEEEYFASAEFSAFWQVYMNASLSVSRNDSIVVTYTVNENRTIPISEFPFFTATLLTLGNYTKLKLEANVSGTFYTLFDDNCSDWRKYVWYLPNIVGGTQGNFTGIRATLYENSTEGEGNASVKITNMGAYTVAVPEYGFPKALGLDFQNATDYDYLFAGDSENPIMVFKFNDTLNSVYTITRSYPHPFSFLNYPYLEAAFSGTSGNYSVELWLQRKYNSENYTWVLLGSFNGSQTSSLRKAVGYNLYAQYNAYGEFFNPETSYLNGWRIVIRGNASEADSKACLFTLKYIALTDYYTGWRIYPGGNNYTGGEGYGGEMGLGAISEQSAIAESGLGTSSEEPSLVQESTVSESFKPSEVDVSELVSWEDYCLSTDGWSLQNQSAGVDAKVVSLSERIELRMRRAAAGDWALFRYDLGEGINVSLTNYLDFRLRTRPEGGLQIVAYAEVSDTLVELGEYSADNIWMTWRVNLLSLLAEAGVSGLVTGLVFQLIRQDGEGRYDCYADLNYLKLSGCASRQGSLSTLFFEDDLYSTFHFESLRGATLVYNIPTNYHNYNLMFNAKYFLEKTDCTVEVYFYNFSSGGWVKATTLDPTDSWESVNTSIHGSFVRSYDGRFLVYLTPQSSNSKDINVNLRLDLAEVTASIATQSYFESSGLLTMGLEGGVSLPTDLEGIFDQLGSEVVWFGEDYYHRRILYWLEGWGFRKPITITENSGENLTNFQVKLVLQGNNANQTDYMDFEKIAPGGADLRVTAEDGLTLIPYWIESWDDQAQTATLWIRCPFLRANETNTFYVYYGCGGVESLSDGSSTFLLFDDFSGNSLDTDRWIATGDVTVDNGTCILGGGSVESLIESTSKYGNQTIVQCRARVSDIWNMPTTFSRTYTVDSYYSDTEVVGLRKLLDTKWSYTNNPTMSYMRLGLRFDESYNLYSEDDFVRFKVDVPKGATITEAIISLKSNNIEGNNTMACGVYLLNYDNCPTFQNNPYKWGTSGSSVGWTPPETTVDVWYNTTDIKNLLQSYINRAGYVPGSSYVGFKIQNNQTMLTEKSWYQYDSGAGNAPKLIVTYTLPFDGESVSAVVSLCDYQYPYSSDTSDLIAIGRYDNATHAGKWSGLARDYPSPYSYKDTNWTTDTNWHSFQIEWRGTNSARLWLDSSYYDGFLNDSSVPQDRELRVMHEANAWQKPNTQLYVDYTFVRKYASSMPSVGYGVEQTPPSGSGSFYEAVDLKSGSEMIHFYFHQLKNVTSIDDYYLEFRLENGVGAVFNGTVQGEPNALIDLYKELRLWLCGVVEPPEDYVGDFSDLNMTVRLYVQYYYENNSAIENGTVLFYETVFNYSENGEWREFVLEVPSQAPDGAHSWAPIIRAMGYREDSFCHLFIDDAKCPKTYQTLGQNNTTVDVSCQSGDGHGHVLNCSNTSGEDRVIWEEFLNIPFSPDLMFDFDVYPIVGDWWLGLKFRVQLYQFLTSYNATVNVSSSVGYVGPVDVYLSFENGTCYEGSLFVMDANATHVPFTIRGQNVSGEYVLSANISILVNVTAGETQTFKIFWSDYDNPLPELVSPNLRVVNWDDNTQSKVVSVNCTATDANMSRVLLHYNNNGIWDVKDMVLNSRFYVGNFSYSESYEFYVEALDNCSNPMRTSTYPDDSPSLGVDVGEGEIYIRDRIPAGSEVVWLYYSDGAGKYLNTSLDSLLYGYTLECAEGWNHFIRLPYSDILEIFIMRYQTLPSWSPMVLERIVGGALGNSSYLLDNLRWGLYPRTVLDYSGQNAMNFYFSYDPTIPVVNIVSNYVLRGVALLNACCSDIPANTFVNETLAGVDWVQYTLSNDTDVVYNGTMFKEHVGNDTYRYTDFWYDYLDTTLLDDGFYKLNVTVCDVSGHKTDDIQYIIIYNNEPRVEFLNVYENESVGAFFRVLARTVDAFQIYDTDLTVYHHESGNLSVYEMTEDYFQNQNIWTYNLYCTQSGNYTLSVNSTNYFGVASDVVSVNISVDVTQPSVIINSPKPNEWVAGEYVLNVTAVDDNNIGSVQWRVYVVANETTGELQTPINCPDTWNNITYVDNNCYVATWPTTDLDKVESLNHRYVVMFRVKDNNTSPNTVYRRVSVKVDNDKPCILDGPSIVAPNNVQEGFTEETGETTTVIYTKFDNATLTFALWDEGLATFYNILGNQSLANLVAYAKCFDISVLDEHENGSRVYSNCTIVDGSGGIYFRIGNYTLINGTHNLTLMVTDAAGNTNQSILKVDIVVDQTPPIVVPILPRNGNIIKRVFNSLYMIDWMFDIVVGTDVIQDNPFREAVLFGVYVNDFESPVLTNSIYLKINSAPFARPVLWGPMTDEYVWYLRYMDSCPFDRHLLWVIDHIDNATWTYYCPFALLRSGYLDLGLTVFEHLYDDRVYWSAVDFYYWDFIWIQQGYVPANPLLPPVFWPFTLVPYMVPLPNAFTVDFYAWDKSGNQGKASSIFSIYPCKSRLECLHYGQDFVAWNLYFGVPDLINYLNQIESEYALIHSGGNGGNSSGGQGSASQVSEEFGYEPLSGECSVYDGLKSGVSDVGLLSEGYGVCGGEGSGGGEGGSSPMTLFCGEDFLSVEQALNYEFCEDVSFLPWMKFSFRVFGAPRDVSLNVKFGRAPYIRLFFDTPSFEKYGCSNDSMLLRASPDTWNTFTIPLYRMAKSLGLFNGLNAPTNISAISVSAYGERKVWERRAVFDNFWIATPVPLVEEYAEKAALSRDNYYQILNVTKESNLEVLKQDISEVFAASYMNDFEYLATVLEDFTQHLFPSGEMQEFTGASVRVMYYNTSISSVPLFVVYSFPEGLENVSLLAAYNYTNIPNVDLSNVLEANITDICSQLALTGWLYGLDEEDLAYLPYGGISFVILNDTVCFDRLSAKPCTIQSVLATISSIAERVWNQRCIAQIVELEEEYQQVEALRAYINESAYRVETFKKLLAALQFVNYMHPYNWDKKSFDTLIDSTTSPYWLSYTYASWGNETGYALLKECLVNITQMLDFGDYFGAPPIFISTGKYNWTASEEGEDCLLIFKALERERGLDYLFGAVQSEVLFAVFNDTNVLNVAREFGRKMNSTLADVYVYLIEMAFMYTRPYNSEELLSDPVFDMIGQLFSGASSFVDQIGNQIRSLIQYFAAIPFVNLVTTLNALFTQKFDRKCKMLGIDNYVEWLAQLEEQSLNDFEDNDTYDSRTVYALDPGETLTEQGGGASQSASSGSGEFGSEPLSQEYTVISNLALSETSMVCGASVSNDSVLPSGYDVSGGSGSGGEQVGSVPSGTSKDVKKTQLYINVDEVWNNILTNPFTVYVLEYTNPKWRTGEPVIPPKGPILYMGNPKESGGKFGFESSRFLFNIVKILQNTFQERTRASPQGFTRSLLAYYIGKHHRDLAKLASLYPDIGVDQALSVFIIDTTNTFIDPTTGIVFPLDDKEQPTGFWDFGITVQLSLVCYGDVDGGFIDETFIIQNDPTTCLARKLWLEQVDSEGKPIITEDRLIRLGLGYYEREGGALHFRSCIDYDTGAITRLPLWDMGFNPNTLELGKNDYVINLNQINEYGIKNRFDTGKFDWDEGSFQKTGEAMIWGKSTKAGDKIVLNLLRQNIDYLLPETTTVRKDPYSVWWMSNVGLSPMGTYAEWQGGNLPSLLDNLMNAFGVNIGEQEVIRSYSEDYMGSRYEGALSLKKIKCISQMLDGMGIAWINGMARKPISFDTVSNTLEQTFVEQSFKAYLEKGIHINVKGQTEGSDRYALEMLQGTEICNVDPKGGNQRINQIFYSVDIDPTILDQTVHTGYSLPRGDMPLFKVPASYFEDQNGNSLLPDSIKPDKNDYVFLGIDIPASQAKGEPVLFVPIFKDAPYDKKDEFISHDNYPSDVIQRIMDTSSPVPILSLTQKFWSSIEKYAVFTYNGKDYKPLLKSSGNTHIYSDSEYTPTSYLEIFHFLGLIENICALTTTHTSADRGEAIITRETLSPAYLFSELKGILVDEPKECLELIKAFGGDKVLAELRKIEPIIPYTNMVQLGWFAKLETIEDVIGAFPKCKEDIESMLQLWKSGESIVPTQVDLLIILLSYTGAQRAKGKGGAYLPIEIDQPLDWQSPVFLYKIGSAIFYPEQQSELELLDRIGVPTDKNGHTFKTANYPQAPDLSFTKLKAKDEQLLLKVGGIKLHNTLEPTDIREAFGGRVTGVPKLDPQIDREKQNPQIFEDLLKFTEIRIPTEPYMRGGQLITGAHYSGYYSFVEWLMSEKMKFAEIFEIDKREGLEKINYMDFLIKGWGNTRSAKILELGKSLNNQDHTRIDDLWALYLHQRSRISPTESSCLGVFGELFEILEGDILEGIGNRYVLDFMAEKFIWSDNPEVQKVGIMMKLMILRQLDPNLQTFVLRPEHLAAGKWELATYLSQYKIYEGSYGPYIYKLDIMGGTPKTVTDTETPEQVKMQLIANILFNGGNIKELLTLGFSKQEVINALDRFESQVVEGKIGEKMSWFQQLGVRHWINKQQFRMQPSLKALKELVKSGAVMGGVSTVIGVGKMLPFLTIVAPILQTIGYAAVAAIEAKTLAPTLKYNATSGEFYVGLGGGVSSFLSNPDWNIMASILMTAGVMITDLMEFGTGAFETIEYNIDMDAINILLAGAQAGMMDLGMCYCPESTLADIMKPLLGLVGIRLHPYLALGFEIAGLVSMLPQVDQFYHERIWPVAKFALGASLMGAEAIIVSSIVNTIAINGINAVENAWENQVFGDPWYQDVQINFTPMLEWLPLDTWGVQDYIDSWITKYVYGMWWM